MCRMSISHRIEMPKVGVWVQARAAIFSHHKFIFVTAAVHISSTVISFFVNKGPVKLIQQLKIAHSILQSVSNLFHFIIFSLPI